MRHLARLLPFALIAAFVAGCWSEPIQIRKSDENDLIPHEARSKERKALLEKLGKAPKPAAEKPAAEAH